jgi:hypothetical protein
MKRPSRVIYLLMAVLLLGTLVPSVRAVTLQLRDGQLVHGEFLGGTKATVNLLVNGKIQSYPVSDILLLDFSSPPPSSSAPAAASAAPAQAQAVAPKPAATRLTVPAGSTIQVRMISAISSSTAKVGDKFQASLNDPITVDGTVVAAKYADVYGRLVQSQSGGTFTGTPELSLELTGIQINGAVVPISTSNYVEAGSSRGKETAKRAGIGAGLGAVIGAIAGGGKGAAIGAGIGGGAGAGSQIITHGKQINVPSESVLAFTLAQPLTVTISNP